MTTWMRVGFREGRYGHYMTTGSRFLAGVSLYPSHSVMSEVGVRGAKTYPSSRVVSDILLSVCAAVAWPD